MGIITRIEDLIGEPLEALFDFHKGTQPVELERFLRKALEKSRVALIGKSYVANVYAIKVNADDFRDYSALAAELAVQLEQSVHEEVREKTYSVLGPVSVAIVPDRSVGKGKVQVTTQFVKEGAEQEIVASPATAPSTAAVAPPQHSVRPVEVPLTVADAKREVIRRIRLEGPAGTLEVMLSSGDLVDLAAPTAGRVLIACRGRVIIVGREGGKVPADVEIEDPGVSRPHCSLRLEDGEAVIEDLGSSNGTWVNGECSSMPIILTSADEAVIGATRISVSRPL